MQGVDGNAQIDTPALAVRPDQTGDYRVSVLGNGQTLVTVRSGRATILAGNGSRTLTPGSTLVANGSSMWLQNAVAFDAFDQFNVARDQAAAVAYNANPYLSPQLAGYANLAGYGQWQNVPGYGYAWAPNNQGANNFAPYQNGQWVWEPGYGYTWVDNAPYGYATSHYGTWFNNANYGGWLWQPPANQYQNGLGLSSAWLPAVVAFFLGGNNPLNLLQNPNGAGIGWIPLAPGEQYQPWYGPNYGYPETGYTNLNNVTNVYNYYTNARYYRGISMVPVTAWRNGNFGRRILLRSQQFTRLYLVRGAIPVVPTTANLHYASASRLSHRVVLSRMFAAPRLAARSPKLARVSFAAQQARIRTIAAERPKLVALPPRATAVKRTVYRPVVRRPVHVTAYKPVRRPAMPSVKRTTYHSVAVPKPVHYAAPISKPVHYAAPISNPVHYAAPVPKPVVHYAAPAPKSIHYAAPISKPVHYGAPVPKPVVHYAAPVAKPETHYAAPAPKQGTHYAAPTPKRVLHSPHPFLSRG